MTDQDLKRHFVQLIKQACERYLAAGEHGTLGWDCDFEIEGIELVPADQSETVDYSYSVRRDDGTFEDVHKQTKPFEFAVRYWNEYGGGEGTAPCRFEKRLGLLSVATEVGKLIAGQIDQIKALNAMHWLRGDDPVTDLTPVEIDTLLLERLRARNEASRRLRAATESILWCFAKRRHYGSGTTLFLHPDFDGPLNVSFEVASQNQIEADQLVDLYRQGHPKLVLADGVVADIERASADLTEAIGLVEEIDQEYKSRPWSRYWLVTSSDGHIHRDVDCSTCNKGREPTGFALVPYLSGSTVEAAVADLGPALCSVCFPGAPVEAREQARIPARVALALAEEGCEAFQAARDKARQEAARRASERCPGAGQAPAGPPDARRESRCPVCGRRSRVTRAGVLEAHRQARWRVSRLEGSQRLYWAGEGAWEPSRWRPLPRAEAEAVLAGAPGARLERL
jgi:hypothetical protein